MLDPFSQLLAREVYANYQAELRKLADNSGKKPHDNVDHYEVRSDGNLVAFLKA
jgi:hypothetical protein